MRIAFVGKGGSGKTTLSALFAKHAAQKKIQVMAIDADINQHLIPTLAGQEINPPAALGENIAAIKEYLRGSNSLIASSSEMIKTTPPGNGSLLLTTHPESSLLQKFTHRVDSIRCLATGGFADTDIGTKCFHSKTGAVELLLNHLVDTPDEVIIVDMTAGADSFASGLFTKFDLTCIVVEPTLKSLSVFDQYQAYAADYGIKLCAIGNKVRSENDLTFLQEKLGTNLLAHITYSEYVTAGERGERDSNTNIEAENSTALEKILAVKSIALSDGRVTTKV